MAHKKKAHKRMKEKGMHNESKSVMAIKNPMASKEGMHHKGHSKGK